MNNLPQARIRDIVVQSLGKEILIYNLLTHKAYNLNETSAIVYQACGDNLTFEELKRKFKFTDEIIYFALDELKANNLIEDYQGNYFAGLSRREVIRKVGLASMIALPIITGLVAPRTVDAQSGGSGRFANGVACVGGNECQSNTCIGSTCCNGIVGVGNTVCSSINDCCFGGNGFVFCSTNSSGVANRCCFGNLGACTVTSQCCTGFTCVGGNCRP